MSDFDPPEFERRWRREERIRLAVECAGLAIEATCFVVGAIGIILALAWVGILQ